MCHHESHNTLHRRVSVHALYLFHPVFVVALVSLPQCCLLIHDAPCAPPQTFLLLSSPATHTSPSLPSLNSHNCSHSHNRVCKREQVYMSSLQI